jgi:hypothetical protein
VAIKGRGGYVGYRLDNMIVEMGGKNGYVVMPSTKRIYWSFPASHGYSSTSGGDSMCWDPRKRGVECGSMDSWYSARGNVTWEVVTATVAETTGSDNGDSLSSKSFVSSNFIKPDSMQSEWYTTMPINK